MSTPISVDLNRRKTASDRVRGDERVWVAGTAIGHGAPVSVQSMCTTLTHDVGATIRRIERPQDAGCEIARVASCRGQQQTDSEHDGQQRRRSPVPG